MVTRSGSRLAINSGFLKEIMRVTVTEKVMVITKDSLMEMHSGSHLAIDLGSRLDSKKEKVMVIVMVIVMEIHLAIVMEIHLAIVMEIQRAIVMEIHLAIVMEIQRATDLGSNLGSDLVKVMH